MPRKTNVCLAAAATAAVVLATGCGASGAGRGGGAAGDAADGAASARPIHAVQPKAAPGPLSGGRPTPTSTAAASTSVTDVGALPQTHVLPGDQDAHFREGAQALWQAIAQGKPELAQSFFFPLSAYKQVKAIWNPAADYQDRLTAWYGLDIEAAHAHLGAAAANAKFVGLSVPEGDAEWIEPGAEYNKGSYYRVYGSRLNYRVNGRESSIGVFSLISWRGEWYVVHLGPSTRPALEGIVYDPAN